MKDAHIDYDTDWRRMHWKGILSAYSSSPYFEFYRDVFEPYYQKEHKFLIDLCFPLIQEVLSILQIQVEPKLTDEFLFPGEHQGIIDLRSLIQPKNSVQTDIDFKIVQYSQVFQEQNGFIPNLSIIDLLFNMGPESRGVLMKSLR